jgi:hypothetical protein
MNFFQRIGNALSRFMYGRNGVDRLGLTMIWAALLLDIINMLLREKPVVSGITGLVSGVLLFTALFRMFSRNLEKRRAENTRFMEKVWWPVSRRMAGARQQRMDKEHRYFTCHRCGAVCRVPRGKGRIVITCPRCGGEIHGKS